MCGGVLDSCVAKCYGVVPESLDGIVREEIMTTGPQCKTIKYDNKPIFQTRQSKCC